MNIKLKRIERKWTQKDFAEFIGVTPQYLRKIENGKVDLKISLLKRIAIALEVPVESLI